MNRALIIDDKEENRYLLRVLLQAHGYDIIEARHGAEALIKARQNPPTVAVSDLLMPVMDGFTLLRHWRADEQLKQVPFVVYTATYKDAKDEQLVFQLGADAFIPKPTEPSVFIQRLQSLMTQVRNGAPKPTTLVEPNLVLEQYNSALVRKLEDKRLELEWLNRELSGREARWRAIFDTEPECVMLLDETGRILEMNPAGLKMLEVDSLEAVQNHSFFTWVAPDHRTEFREMMARVFGGDSAVIEYEVCGAKGGRRWFEAHSTPLSGSNEGRALLSVGRDVTERRAVQVALAAKNETLAAISESLAAYVEHGDFRAAMGRLLRCALQRTRSEYGFIGVVVGSTLRVLAYEGFVWDREVNRAYYERARRSYEERGYLEFTSFDNLFGAAIKTAQVVICNDPSQDPRSGGRPSGHPPMHSFLGVPIYAGHEVQGLVALANRPGGYTPEQQHEIETLVQHAGGLCTSYRQREITVASERERHRAELALRDSEEKYRSLVEHLKEVVFRTDGQGRWIFLNPAWTEVTGYSVEECIGRNFLEFVSPADHTRAWELFHPLIELRRTYCRDEVRYLTKDGATRWMTVFARLSLNTEGAVVGTSGTLTDITERKQAEEALRASQERLRELAETIEEVFWAIDPTQRRVLYISPAYEKIWGRSCQSLYDAPLSWLESVHPEDRERVRESLRAKLARGEYDEEYRIVRADAEVRWIRDRGFPVFDASGGVQRAVGVARDVTDRKLAQIELQRREEHFRCLIEQASDIITVVNNQGCIRFQSPAVRHILGFEPAEVQGASAFDFIHPEDVPGVVAALKGAIESPGTTVSAEYRARHRDGRWRTLQTVGRSIPEQAEEGFVVLNSRDITESRQLEEQFRQSQKMEAIGQLAGGVAHDFNNILAVILMQADLTRDVPDLPAEAQESLEQIRTAAERAANLTRQLLLFSRRQVLQPRDLDLNEIVTNLSRFLQRIIGEDIRLQLHLHSAPLMTRADSGMLDQILMNLAVNARDAMPQGGRLLVETTERHVSEAEAREHADATPGAFVVLTVSDTGVGIPPEVLPRIFEPFFTTKEPGKGTGLGLATVFGIVKQHKGWVKVTSQVSQGTTFEIFLPASAVAQADSRDGVPIKPRRGSETILLAEDDPAVRVLTRMTLQRFGYRVVEAASGVEALRLWPEHRNDVALLLTDLVMPGGVTGQQLARRVQEDNPRLKVVFTSGYSAEIAGKEMELRSGENFVQKPYTPDRLLDTVRRCLDETA
jgi:two-component system, cell cycle sensor histidine kinase and response regulator CckA